MGKKRRENVSRNKTKQKIGQKRQEMKSEKGKTRNKKRRGERGERVVLWYVSVFAER